MGAFPARSSRAAVPFTLCSGFWTGHPTASPSLHNPVFVPRAHQRVLTHRADGEGSDGCPRKPQQPGDLQRCIARPQPPPQAHRPVRAPDKHILRRTGQREGRDTLSWWQETRQGAAGQGRGRAHCGSVGRSKVPQATLTISYEAARLGAALGTHRRHGCRVRLAGQPHGGADHLLAPRVRCTHNAELRASHNQRAGAAHHTQAAHPGCLLSQHVARTLL